MRVTSGTVVSGQVVLDDTSLSEGASVWVISREEDQEAPLAPDELAELEAGIAEADHGETISGDEFFARLRRFG